MATVTPRVSYASTSNNQIHTTGAFATDTNDLVAVIAVNSGSLTETPICSDNAGGTYTKVASSWVSGADTNIHIYLRDSLIASGTGRTVSVNWGADPTTGAMIHVFTVSGMSRAGASAARQGKGVNLAFAAGGTPQLTFDSACLAENPIIVAMQNSTNPAGVTPPAGWTEAYDIGYNTPATGSESAYRNSGFTGTVVTWGSTSATAGDVAGVELDASAAASQTVSPDLLDQAGVTFSPLVSPPGILPALLDQAGVTFSPLVGPPGILPALLDQAGVTFSPLVSPPGILPALLDQAGVVFGPTVGATLVEPGLIDQTGTTFTPLVSPAGVLVGLIDQSGTVFGPTFNQTVAVAFIDQAGEVLGIMISGGEPPDEDEWEDYFEAHFDRSNCDNKRHRHYWRRPHEPRYIPIDDVEEDWKD